MDLDGATQTLRAHGLLARSEPGPTLNAAADSSSGADGTSGEHPFSLSIHRATSGWVLRLNSGGDGEEFPELDDAVLRALREFHDYRELHSPRIYGDRFARFESAEPLLALEAALMNEGWIKRDEVLIDMGLKFVAGANFRIPFDTKQRIVLVLVNPSRSDDWQLTVKCYQEAFAGSTAKKIPIRGHQSDGKPLVDAWAPELSYQVAAVLHPALAAVASNVKWSVHHDPTCGPYSTQPLPPEPAHPA
jgi:hypothetical protein